MEIWLCTSSSFPSSSQEYFYEYTSTLREKCREEASRDALLSNILAGWKCIFLVSSEETWSKHLELFDAIEQLVILAEVPVIFTRNVMQHRDTSLYHIDLSSIVTAEHAPKIIFLAAQGDFLIFHLGDSPAPLLHLLDRLPTAIQNPITTNTLFSLELPLAQLLKAARGNRKPLNKNSSEGLGAMIQLLQETEGSHRFEVLARKKGITYRYTPPRSHIQLLAEALKQEIVQQMWKQLGILKERSSAIRDFTVTSFFPLARSVDIKKTFPRELPRRC